MRRPPMRSPMSASHPGRSRPRHPFALALLLALPVAAWGCTVEHHPGNGSLGAELTSDDCTAGELFGGVDDSGRRLPNQPASSAPNSPSPSSLRTSTRSSGTG